MKDDRINLGGEKITKLDYCIVFLLLCVSGNVSVMMITKWYAIIFTLILIIISSNKHKPISNKRFFHCIIVFSIIFSLQALTLPSISFNADINFLARFYIAFLTTSLLGIKFRKVYLKIMFYLSIISILCFFYIWLTNSSFGFIIGNIKSIIVFNHIINDDLRNSGMFWEPGAYEGYLMVIPLLFLNDVSELWSKHKKECIIIFIAILTTKSTTGYLALFVLFSAYIINSSLKTITKIFYIILISIISVTVYNSFDFIGEKIMNQYQYASRMDRFDTASSRMGAFKTDLINIERHPITGNGFLINSRYSNDGESMQGAGNGFSGIINQLGLICGFMYFFLIYKNFKIYYNTKKIITLMLIIFILLNGEYFLNYPLFWTFMFIQMPQQNYKLLQISKI